MRYVLSLLAIGYASAGSCSYTSRVGVCTWPFQQQYRNLSVANATDMGAACCAACMADPKCDSYFVRSEQKSGVPPKTCILNDKPIQGHAPNASDCISGSRPPATFPPTPAPAPAPTGAKNGKQTPVVQQHNSDCSTLDLQSCSLQWMTCGQISMLLALILSLGPMYRRCTRPTWMPWRKRA